MPTENRRIATYLPKQIDERLEAFKAERSIKGDSQALIAILSEFFGVSQQVAHQVDYSNSVTQQRLEALEAEVSGLSNKLSELFSGLLSELPKEIQRINERIDAIQTKSPGVNVASPLPPSDSFTDSLEGLLNKSLQEDAVIESPTDSPSEPLQVVEPVQTIKRSRGRPKKELLNGHEDTFSTGDLAKRLKMNSSSLSKWKPGAERAKSTEKLLEATRKLDPEGIGWIYMPEIKRFKPEREPSSDSPSILQSELLDDMPQVD